MTLQSRSFPIRAFFLSCDSKMPLLAPFLFGPKVYESRIIIMTYTLVTTRMHLFVHMVSMEYMFYKCRARQGAN